VAEAVHHTEQSRVTGDAHRDRLITGDVLAR
jgi:hypothetical protein